MVHEFNEWFSNFSYDSAAENVQVRIVALTSFSDDIMRRKALETGMSDFLAKPAKAL